MVYWKFLNTMLRGLYGLPGTPGSFFELGFVISDVKNFRVRDLNKVLQSFVEKFLKTMLMGVYDPPGTPGSFIDLGFVISDVENPRLSNLNKFVPSLVGKSP